MNIEQSAKNWNIQSKKLESLFKEIYPQIKENPNNWPIIKKWNRIIYNKYKFDLFNALEEEIELQFFTKKDFIINNLVNIKIFDK